MRALGFPVKKEEVRKVLADYDKETGGTRIGWDDFLEVSEYTPRAIACSELRSLPRPPLPLCEPRWRAQ